MRHVRRKGADQVDPRLLEADENLELLVQEMIQQGVVERSAPSPVYQHQGLHGRRVDGHTPEVINYFNPQVSSFLEGKFKETSFDYLDQQIPLFSAEPTTERISEMLELFTWSEMIFGRLNCLKSDHKRVYQAQDDNIPSWPDKISGEHTRLRERLTTEINLAIRTGLIGIEREDYSGVIRKVANLQGIYEVSRSYGFKVEDELYNALFFWKGLEAVALSDKEKEDHWKLTPAQDYWGEAKRSYLRSLKQDWLGSVLLFLGKGCSCTDTHQNGGEVSVVGCTPPNFDTTGDILTNVLVFLAIKTGLDLTSVAASMIGCAYKSHQRRKEVRGYNDEMGLGKAYGLVSPQDMETLVYNRTKNVFLRNKGNFVSLVDLYKEVFPSSYLKRYDSERSRGEDEVKRDDFLWIGHQGLIKDAIDRLVKEGHKIERTKGYHAFDNYRLTHFRLTKEPSFQPVV
jgi:hypothetical protein